MHDDIDEPPAPRRMVVAFDWWERECVRMADYPAKLNARSVRKPITLTDWAKRCGMSREKLGNIIKMRSVPTPAEYWLWRRAIGARLSQHTTPARWLGGELARLNKAAESKLGGAHVLAEKMGAKVEAVEKWLSVGPDNIVTLAEIREALGFQMFGDHIGGGELKRVRVVDRLAALDVASPPTKAVQIPAVLLHYRSTIHVVRVWAALVSNPDGAKAFTVDEVLALAFDGRAKAREQCSRILHRMGVAGCARYIRDGELAGRWIATWPQSGARWANRNEV